MHALRGTQCVMPEHEYGVTIAQPCDSFRELKMARIPDGGSR